MRYVDGFINNWIFQDDTMHFDSELYAPCCIVNI